MTKNKQDVVKETLTRIVDKDIPYMMGEVMAWKGMDAESRAKLISLLDTMLHTTRLLQAQLE